MNWKFWKNKEQKQLTEGIAAFKEKPAPTMRSLMNTRGEGWETIQDIPGVGNVGLQSFNMFYNSYINRMYENELGKIEEYRNMAMLPEIGDVIEDAVNESTQENETGDLVHLDITDSKLEDNENILKNITDEFRELFENRINLADFLWEAINTYYIDGRVFFEKIIDTNNKKKGIIGLKKLPSETMDYLYNPLSGKYDAFFQYLKPKTKKPVSIEEAMERDGKDLIFFYPNQIGFINANHFGKTKYEIFGYLEKARVPYNQLKLLETSVIIYRIIRAPERLVFRIDTGNMPNDKALKYVEKIKQKMSKKQTYDPSTGKITQEPEVLCIRKNTEIPLTDGRNLSLEKIIEEYKDGKENYVYSFNKETYNIEEKKILYAAITRKNEKLIRVWLENDEYIDCTYDHKFLVWKDKNKKEIIEVEAQYLTEEMEIVDNENMLG